MATDVVFILTRAGTPLARLRAHLTAHRAQQDPHRFLKVDLRFDIEGAVPTDAVERADRAVARQVLLGLAFAQPRHRFSGDV